MKPLKPFIFLLCTGILPVLILFPGNLAAEEKSTSADNVEALVSEAKRVAAEWTSRIRDWQEGKAQSSAYMGIIIEPVPDVLRDYIELSKGVGLLLPHITKDSPAMKAGLKDNDIIISFAGQIVININQLSTLIDLEGPGSTVPVTVLRKGEEMEFEVTLVERPNRRTELKLPESPESPEPPEAPSSEDLGSYMERIEEWIPGSVQIYVDENEQVHVDMDDLKKDLRDLRVELLKIKKNANTPAVIRKYGDMGARTSVVHVADRNINYKGKDGSLVLTSSEAGQQAMVWDAEGNLLYEGELPDNYEEVLPDKAVDLINSVRDSYQYLEGESAEDIEIHLSTEKNDPVTLMSH